MKKSEMELYLEQIIIEHHGYKDTNCVLAGNILKAVEEAGMLPPERPDEHPLGYGGGWLDEEEVELNYKLFKHSWEPEDD